jgi:prepilin-type N-terminal cleavage/methylation domain-containing protein
MGSPSLHPVTCWQDAKRGRHADGFSLLEMMMVVTVGGNGRKWWGGNGVREEMVSGTISEPFHQEPFHYRGKSGSIRLWAERGGSMLAV